MSKVGLENLQYIYLFFSSFYSILLRTNHWAISVSPPKIYGKKIE